MTGDGGARPTTLQGERKKRKASVRRVLGRLRDIDVGAGRFTFELTKAGLVVHRKNARRKTDLTIPFSRLTEGGGHQCAGPDGGTVLFAVTDGGVEVRRAGSKQAMTIPLVQVANMANSQPLLIV